MDAFLLELESGKLDPDLHEAEQEAESPTPAKDSAPNGEAAQSNNGDAPDGSTAPATTEDQKPNVGGDDEMQFNVDAEDQGDDHDPSRADANGKQQGDAKRQANRGEELSIPPEGNQIMIRTIPPDIGRMKLEEASHIERLY